LTPLSADYIDNKGRYFLFMMSSNYKTSGINQIIARAVEQNPHSKDILKAFGPIVARQRCLSSTGTAAKMDFSSINQEKLKAGVPVIQQISLFSPEEPLQEIISSLAAAVREGMPALAEDLDQFSELIQKDKLNPSDYFKEYLDRKNSVMDRWAEKLQTPNAPGLFLMSLTARVILEARAKEIAAYLGEFPWEKGYCPICGELPSIALIQEEGGKRFLHCSSCGHDWRFTRVVCPYCENEAQQGMTYFYVENKTQESAFICEKCRKYLVTLNRAGSLFARDMDISAISLLHLDMIMQDKGYKPMATCLWNVLS
jgi:FdhE protein